MRILLKYFHAILTILAKLQWVLRFRKETITRYLTSHNLLQYPSPNFFNLSPLAPPPTIIFYNEDKGTIDTYTWGKGPILSYRPVLWMSHTMQDVQPAEPTWGPHMIYPISYTLSNHISPNIIAQGFSHQYNEI